MTRSVTDPHATGWALRRSRMWLALLLVVSACSSASPESLEQALDMLQVPADWSVLTDETFVECALVDGVDCPDVTRTWRASGSEETVLTALVETAAAAGYAADSKTTDCRPDVPGDCIAIVANVGVTVTLAATGSSADDLIIASASATS